MAKDKSREVKSTVFVEKIVTKPEQSFTVSMRIFREGNIEITGKMSRDQFDRALKGNISVDINQLWNRYQNWLNKK